MADNFTFSIGGNTITIAADDIAGVLHQRFKLAVGVDGSATDVSTSNPLPVSIPGTVPVSGTFYPATQPVSGAVSISGSVAVTGPLTDTQIRATPLPVSFGGSLPAGTNNIGDVDVLSLPALPAGNNNIGDVDVASLPALPTGANTIGAVNQAGVWNLAQLGGQAVSMGTGLRNGGTQRVTIATDDLVPISAASLPLPSGAATNASLATVGTRAYSSGITRLGYTGTTAATAAITATEVLVHNCGAGRCFIATGSAPAATVNDIPLEAGEKFHLRITSGHKVAAIRESADGSLNVVPVA